MRINQRAFLVTIILMAMVLFLQGSPAAQDLPVDSDAARKLVETYLATNADNDAASLLFKIVSTDSFKDIRSWASIQYYNLAQKKDGVSSAIEKLEAIAKNSNNVSLQRSIADGYMRLGDWAKVGEIYENLLKDNPNDAILFKRMVTAYMMANDYDMVIKTLEPRVAADPDDIASSDLLAQAYVRVNRPEEAVALYQKKIAKKPNSAGLRSRYAQGLSDLGMLEESLAEWNAAFQLAPRTILFKQKIAETYMQMGKTAEAKKQYLELIDLIPADQTAYRETITSRIKDIEAEQKKE